MEFMDRPTGRGAARLLVSKQIGRLLIERLNGFLWKRQHSHRRCGTTVVRCPLLIHDNGNNNDNGNDYDLINA